MALQFRAVFLTVGAEHEPHEHEPSASPGSLSRVRAAVSAGRWARGREFPPTLPASRWLRTPPSWVLGTLLIAFLTYPFDPVPPGTGGYDISWITGINVAAHLGLHWGSQFNYTYGPLGYLTTGSLFYDSTGIPADLVIAALYVAVLLLVARPLFARFGLLLGGLMVFVLTRMCVANLDIVELLSPLLVAMGIWALRRDTAVSPRFALGLGALAAFSVLGKLSVGSIGTVVVAVVAVAALLRPQVARRERLREFGILVGGFVAALLVLWLLAGQSLFDLPAYVRNGVDAITGYDDAEAAVVPSLNYQYWWALGLTVVALATVFWQDRELPWLRRAGIAVLWLWFGYAEFRHAFVRFQPGHAVLFFIPVAVLGTAVLIGRRRWRMGLLTCLVALAAIWTVGTWNVPTLFTTSSFGAVDQINLLLSPNLRRADREAARKGLRAGYGFTPALVARMTGQTVHFDPWEATIAWAYPQIRWDPAPVFQSYNAYTAHLDDLNAAFLAGPRAPRYVLRQNAALDTRDPRFESPRYMLTLLCRYREVMTVGGWQLLERGPNRCGVPIPAGGRLMSFDRRFAVPPPSPHSIVVASFTDFSQPFLDTLGQLLFKRRIQYIATNQTTFRFVPGSAANPHVMSFPACAGWSPSFLDPTPYAHVGIGHTPQIDTPGATETGYGYLVSFERIPFNCG